MVFEVKATHRDTATGHAACEVHPGLFVDEWGRIFETPGSATEGNAAAVQTLRTDDAIELAVGWIEVLSRGTNKQWLEQRSQRRWSTSPEAARFTVPGIDRVPRRGDRRTVAFEVRASHRLRSGADLACEIYPDVFVSEHNRGALSRLAGMAMQQPGDIVDALPAGTQDWFRVRGLEHAASWVGSITRSQDDYWRKHHDNRRTFDESPIGPMGPACPPRRRLNP